MKNNKKMKYKIGDLVRLKKENGSVSQNIYEIISIVGAIYTVTDIDNKSISVVLEENLKMAQPK